MAKTTIVHTMSQDLEEEIKDDCLENLRTESEERLKMAQYYKAEFENYKRRNQEIAAKAFADGKIAAINEILGIGDSLNEAVKVCEADKEGMQILVRKFSQALQSLGVEEIESVGKPFDPSHHNAIATGKGETDYVLEEFQKGYKLGGKLLRPATVKVGK